MRPVRSNCAICWSRFGRRFSVIRKFTPSFRPCSVCGFRRLCPLDIELFAYVKTTKAPEFLSVREEVFLQVMDIVNESGTGFAFPSQTLYLGRDSGLDPKRTEKAEAQMRQWQEEGCTPNSQTGQTVN